MSKQWKPDTWETLCMALAKDKDLMVWVWTVDGHPNRDPLHIELTIMLGSVKTGYNLASLEDPRTKDPSMSKSFCAYCNKEVETASYDQDCAECGAEIVLFTDIRTKE